MSKRQIETAFEKLIKDGLIITGNYNKLAYDRTLWYALTQKGKCILHFGEMENIKTANAIPQNATPIPNINTGVNADINSLKKERKKATSYDEILSNITDADLRDLYYEYIKMRKLIKSPMTDRALVMLINKVNDLEPVSLERQKQMLSTAIMNNWKSVYPLKADKPQQSGTGNMFLDMLAERGAIDSEVIT